MIVSSPFRMIINTEVFAHSYPGLPQSESAAGAGTNSVTIKKHLGASCVEVKRRPE
jgi:hypothetical protein